MNHEAQPHWIRENHVTRQPRRWVWLDTEARSDKVGAAQRQSWLLGVTAFDDLDPRRKHAKPTEWATHRDPESLWAWVVERTKAHARTVLVAHNLAYDLRVSRAMEVLPALGWTLVMIRLDGGQAWCRWSSDGRSLTMVDSTSWLPAGLDRIGAELGMVKPPLPGHHAPADVWERRCVADVEILRAAMLRVWGWLESADLGVWQMTGAGCAWSAWRHRFLDHQVLAACDPAQSELERVAAWTGRCEAWRWGRLAGRRWVELDMEMAYAQVAATELLPTKLAATFPKLTGARLAELVATHCMLATVDVDTEVPCVPAEVDGRIVWPVGRFRTTLWSPELALLFECGATVTPVCAWGYRSAPALQRWALWCMALARGEGDGRDPLVRMVAKHWSRALIGRFGLRYRSWEPAGSSARSDCQLIPGADLASGERYRWLQVGRELFLEGAPVDSPNAVPAVMAYVMSECRARLWRCMTAAGLDHVAYVDTDSLIVDAEGAQRLQEARKVTGAYNLRQKGSWTAVEVLGPRQLVLDRQVRAAGMPKRVERRRDGSFEGEVWRGLGESLRRGESGEVVVERRRFRLAGRDRRRLHLEGGSTAALTLPLGESGAATCSSVRPAAS